MKHFYALVIFILLSFQLHAQRNFKPGYILTLNGDTIKGFVDHKEWDENPRQITFKTTEQTTAQQYTPNTIKAFGVDQVDHFQRYIGPVTTGAVELADLSSGIDSAVVTDAIFLRIITGGKNLTLYSYNDRIKTRYFIAERNAAPVELRRYVYLDNRQSDKIREHSFYIQQLLALAIKYAPDNAALTESINKAPYKAPALEDVILKLNGLTNNYKTNAAKRGGSRFFIGIGANVVQASFFGRENIGFAKTIFDSNTKTKSVAPTIAAGADFYFNKNVRRLFFRTELNVTMSKISASYKGSYWDYFREIGREEDLTINQISAAFNPQLVYNIYNTEKVKFFVAGGVQIIFASSSNDHYYGRNYLNGALEGSSDTKLLYRKGVNNFTVKAGLTLANKIDVYMGYFSSSQITDYANKGIDVAYYRVGINYLLKLK